MTSSTLSNEQQPISTRHPAQPDVAFAVLPLLRRLQDTLQAAARFRELYRSHLKKKRWGVPDLFFFDPDLSSEWDKIRNRGNPLDDDLVSLIATRDPIAVEAHGDVNYHLADAITVLAANVDARHTARAIPGLSAAAEAIASDYPRAREFSDLLKVTDDEIILVLHPAANTGYRIWVRGIADLYQFHALLADVLTGDPLEGLIPGPRPDARVVAAYRNKTAEEPAPIAYARFQFLTLSALTPNGTVPIGFQGSDHWLWGPEFLSTLPQVNGERVVLIGEPTVRTSWDAVRKLPWLTGELKLHEVVSSSEVQQWIRERTGHSLHELQTRSERDTTR